MMVPLLVLEGVAVLPAVQYKLGIKGQENSELGETCAHFIVVFTVILLLFKGNLKTWLMMVHSEPYQGRGDTATFSVIDRIWVIWPSWILVLTHLKFTSLFKIQSDVSHKITLCKCFFFSILNKYVVTWPSVYKRNVPLTEGNSQRTRLHSQCTNTVSLKFLSKCVE